MPTARPLRPSTLPRPAALRIARGVVCERLRARLVRMAARRRRWPAPPHDAAARCRRRVAAVGLTRPGRLAGRRRTIARPPAGSGGRGVRPDEGHARARASSRAASSKPGPRDQRRRRQRPAVRRRADRPDPDHRRRRASSPTPFLDLAARITHRRRAGPARPRVPPELQPNRRTSTSTSPTQRQHRRSAATASSARPERRRPRERGRILHDRPAVRQPQRRQPRVRARRLPVHRDGRRRQRRRPGQPRPEHRTRLLGKILRIDVDHRPATQHYRSRPTTRTSAGPGSTRSGRAACATRGGSRSTARPATLWIGDVGQDRYEEIDRAPESGRRRPAAASTSAGACSRAGPATSPPTGCSTSGKTTAAGRVRPRVTGADNCAVTGGFVYRGSAYPALVRRVRLRRLLLGPDLGGDPAARTPATPTLVRDATAEPAAAISSFGQDEDGRAVRLRPRRRGDLPDHGDRRSPERAPVAPDGRRRRAQPVAAEVAPGRGDQLRVDEQLVAPSGRRGSRRAASSRRRPASRRRRGTRSSGPACPPARSRARGGSSGRPS